MYKCTTDSDIIMNLLVQYYNMIIQHKLIPRRWIDVLDIILDKGKGPVLRKLRIIQLIEADLQILMHIFVGYRNKGEIEKDS